MCNNQPFSENIAARLATNQHRFNKKVWSLFTDASFLMAISLILVGSCMQAYANGTIGAFFVAFFLLAAGYTVVSIVFINRSLEHKAFLLTYAICLFVGGLAQCYSLLVFGNLQSTVDAFTFFEQISSQPPFTTLADMPLFNSPLAVVIWQQLYKLTWWLGIDFGPYTAVMFNGLIMGITGSITVHTARELFGDDAWRLRRVGLLFAFCGLFILFGAVLLRDCFTTFFNALVLWGIIQWLVRPTFRNLLLATAMTALSAYAMAYLRIEAVLLFGLYWLLAFMIWFTAKGLNWLRMIMLIVSICFLLVMSNYLIDVFQTTQGIQAKGMESYAEYARKSSSENSLGMRLIVNQPFPIRLLLGGSILMINPIPLWAYFKIGALDYDWIKGYNGLYQILVLPFLFVGYVTVVKSAIKNLKHSVPILFLAVYLLINMAVVVVTSLEQRHIGQFMPAFMILAALPDLKDKKTRNYIKIVSIYWFVVVGFVHLLWMYMKG